MANLYINLILDSERRSSSRVSRRFIGFLAAGLAMVFLVAAVLVSWVGAYSAGQQLRFVEQEKKRLEPLHKSVTVLRQELTELQNLTNSIAAWAASRPDWPNLLSGIQSAVPRNIQLTRLTVNETLSSAPDAPGRIVTLFVQGKAVGERSAASVQQLEKDLRERKPFCDIMEKAEVKQFEADKSRTRQNTRIFELECRFKLFKLFKPVDINAKAAK